MEKRSKKNNEENEKWQLTPKSCLAIAINETSISDFDMFVEDERRQKFESTYTILERRIDDAGYITDKDGKTKYDKNTESPMSIFSRTIKGFYPVATEEQISAAWDLFIYHMERQGITTKIRKNVI